MSGTSFLPADVYGSQRCVTDGVIPRSLVASSQYFYRSVAGIEPGNGVRVHVSGIDLVRDQHGIWRVLEDNVRVPSGVSYVLSDRIQRWARRESLTLLAWVTLRSPTLGAPGVRASLLGPRSPGRNWRQCANRFLRTPAAGSRSRWCSCRRSRRLPRTG